MLALDELLEQVEAALPLAGSLAGGQDGDQVPHHGPVAAVWQPLHAPQMLKGPLYQMLPTLALALAAFLPLRRQEAVSAAVPAAVPAAVAAARRDGRPVVQRARVAGRPAPRPTAHAHATTDPGADGAAYPCAVAVTHVNADAVAKRCTNATPHAGAIPASNTVAIRRTNPYPFSCAHVGADAETDVRQ